MDITKITKLLEPVIRELGFSLASTKYYARGKEHYLEVVIDNFLTPISLDDIVLVSETISPLLDDVAELSSTYILDVTSSGAEKEIPKEHYTKYINAYVTVTTNVVVKTTTKHTGTLVEVNNTNVIVRVNQKGKFTNITINNDDINKINLAIKF